MTDLSCSTVESDAIERGARLEDNRKKLNLKAITVYESLNIAQTTYKNYELGKRDIPSSTLVQLSKLGFDIDYILFGKKDDGQAGEMGDCLYQVPALAKWLLQQPETSQYQINRIIDIKTKILKKTHPNCMPEDLINWLNAQPQDTLTHISDLVANAEDAIKNPDKYKNQHGLLGLDEDVEDWLIKQPVGTKGKINSLLRFMISHFF